MNNTKSNILPLLAVTMGDPAGIGPEIAAKTFAGDLFGDTCRLLLVGHAPTMQETLNKLNIGLQINILKTVNDYKNDKNTLNLFPIGTEYTELSDPGKINKIAGDIAFQAVVTAIDLANKKLVDGTVTGPIHKESINLAGHHFSGHTEIYAHYTKTKKYAMLLAGEDLRVIHVTTHVSLRQACDLIQKNRIMDVIQLMYDALIQIGIKDPKIGVAGLNPHSGDGGLFGTEDTQEILPAVKAMQEKGINAEGPVPADALFALANGGKYDGCVAMYHDQGHIPFKVLGFKWDKRNKSMKSVNGVNITLGLPIIRTSVDHGTAFEIAGKGIASPDALVQAIDYALKLVN
jgi:4-hydroxythreonine-4-phosphate dehydrogenase